MVTRIARAYLLLATSLAFAVSVVGQCVTPSFEAGISVAAGGSGPRGDFASGDFNDDGRTDLVVPRFITNTISVLLGNATGGPTVVLVTSVQGPMAVEVGDFPARYRRRY